MQLFLGLKITKAKFGITSDPTHRFKVYFRNGTRSIIHVIREITPKEVDFFHHLSFRARCQIIEKVVQSNPKLNAIPNFNNEGAGILGGAGSDPEKMYLYARFVDEK